MDRNILNRLDLSHYGLMKAQVIELDESIREAQDELTELNKYNISVSPVITGMPKGNEKKDKIADFVIRLEKDRQRLNNRLSEMTAERAGMMYRLYLIRSAVNKIPDKQLRDVIIRHYLDGESIIEIAESYYISANGIYKKINRFFQRGKRNP